MLFDCSGHLFPHYIRTSLSFASKCRRAILEQPKQMLYLDAHPGLGLLDFTNRLVQRAAFAVFLVGAAQRRNLLDDLASYMLFAFFDPGIASISAHHVLRAMRQFVDLGDVRDIGLT